MAVGEAGPTSSSSWVSLAWALKGCFLTRCCHRRRPTNSTKVAAMMLRTQCAVEHRHHHYAAMIPWVPQHIVCSRAGILITLGSTDTAFASVHPHVRSDALLNLQPGSCMRTFYCSGTGKHRATQRQDMHRPNSTPSCPGQAKRECLTFGTILNGSLSFKEDAHLRRGAWQSA